MKGQTGHEDINDLIREDDFGIHHALLDRFLTLVYPAYAEHGFIIPEALQAFLTFQTLNMTALTRLAVKRCEKRMRDLGEP